MRVCEACAKRVKNWNGSDPICAFRNGNPFNPDNWNCATVNQIREIVEDNHYEGASREFSATWRHEDQSAASIDVSRIDMPRDYDLTLWVTWYKHRGRTEAMYLLGANSEPRPPYEDECVAVIDYYRLATQTTGAA
jgi:hypothetical protein